MEINPPLPALFRSTVAHSAAPARSAVRSWSTAAATLSPGTSPGILHVGGDLTLSTGAAYLVDLNGAALGTQYDQTDVMGTVSLGGATLSLNLGFMPGAGDQFTIIQNGGTDPVLGTFNQLPEGTTFNSGGESFTISYQGGTGNDVVLTAAVPEPPTLVLLMIAAVGWYLRRRGAA